jgi:opacity protein-like surface antigen
MDRVARENADAPIGHAPPWGRAFFRRAAATAAITVLALGAAATTDRVLAQQIDTARLRANLDLQEARQLRAAAQQAVRAGRCDRDLIRRMEENRANLEQHAADLPGRRLSVNQFSAILYSHTTDESLAKLKALCPQFASGTGFFIGGGGAGGWSHNSFDVRPQFDVNGSGGLGNVYAGYLFPIGTTGFAFGPQVGWMGGNIHGTIANPEAARDNAYSVNTHAISYVEGFLSMPLGMGRFNQTVVSSAWAFDSVFHVSVGAARVEQQVNCTCGASDSSTHTGITASVGIEQFLTPTFSLGAYGRYVSAPSHNFSIPAQVPIKGEVWIAGINVTWYPGSSVTFSDVRLKRDIVALGQLDNGLTLYRYRYLWSEELFVGVMAQEVAELVPDAVTLRPEGYLAVDYAQLGLRLQTWDEWAALD